MRCRQFYIGLGTDTAAYHEHGGDDEANITIWCRFHNGSLGRHGRVEVKRCPGGLRIRFYNALGELVAELLNGIALSIN